MTALELGFPFSDHLVLKRDQVNPVWGKDAPGTVIRLQVLGPNVDVSAEARCDENGDFVLACPPLPPGSGYRMRVTGSSELWLEDVASGEVWLASGQSNMEWSVSASADADREIEDSRDPELRMLKVEAQTAWEPQRKAHGSWQCAHPDSTGSFSAVGYFFARELRKALDVPVGIIDSTWGGTPIAAWTSPRALKAVLPDVDAQLAALQAELENVPALTREYEKILASWESTSFPADPPLTGKDKGYAEPDFDDSAWGTLKLPAFWQNHGMNFNGVVWFRREVEIPDSWAGRELELSLGAIDDFDHTYFNGELIGSLPSPTPRAFQTPRIYRVPGSLVRPGRNVIAVRVFDHFGQGGFCGPARALKLSLCGSESEPSLPLSGAWRLYAEHPIPLISGEVFRTYPRPPLILTPEYIPGALHHGMICPLVPYGLSGFLWYQGESDVDNHADYARRQTAFIEDLRAHFQTPAAHSSSEHPLPFLFVELAGYRGGSFWPYLREAQQKAAAHPHTGMITARDLGDPDDIHPRNKQEVGRRLAALARKQVYGEDVKAHGPALLRVEIHEQEAHLFFSHAEGLRSRDPDALRGFELAGADRRYFSAQAKVSGSKVIVTSSAVPAPVTVRYAFTDTGEGDLENGAGLPALSFRTDLEPPVS